MYIWACFGGDYGLVSPQTVGKLNFNERWNTFGGIDGGLSLKDW